MIKRKLISLFVLVALLLLAPSTAQAQTKKVFKSKQLKIVSVIYDSTYKEFYAITDTYNADKCRFVLSIKKKDIKAIKNSKVVVEYAKYKNFDDYYIVNWYTVK